MKILIDTHILIQREFDRAVERHLSDVIRYINDLNYQVVVHPRSVAEIEKDKNIPNRSALLSKIRTYSCLNSQSNPYDDKDFFKVIQKPKSERDTVDSYLLYCLYRREVDIFLTEDADIMENAALLSISNKVMSMQKAAIFFKNTLNERKAKGGNAPVFCFYKKGAHWYIGEKDREISFEHQSGFGFIHYMLGKEYKQLRPAVIYQCDVVSGDEGKTSEREIIELDLNPESSLDNYSELLSKEQIRSYKAAINQLQHDIDTGDTDDNDLSLSAEENIIKNEKKMEQIAWIKRELKQNSYNKIRPKRDHHSQQEKARTNVTRSIKRALSIIHKDKTIASITGYLNKGTIRTGDTCSYYPVKAGIPIWILDPP